MSDNVPREIAGPLPAVYADQLDLTRLHGFVERALMGQPPEIRNPLLEHARSHPLELCPFDDRGYLTVAVDGHDVLRLHWTRLMPDAPEH